MLTAFMEVIMLAVVLLIVIHVATNKKQPEKEFKNVEIKCVIHVKFFPYFIH